MYEEGLVDTLTQKQKRRLGPVLQRFVTGDSTATSDVVAEGEMRDGEKVFSVIIESDDANALREADIPLTSVAGSIITARLTMPEILRTAEMEAVRSIRTDRDVQQTGSERPQLETPDGETLQRPSRGQASGGGQRPEMPQSGTGGVGGGGQ